jgi:hypothetical protein
MALVVTAVLLQAGAASANPIALEVARAKQVPGTLHVQLTYAYDGTSADKPTKLTRDGSALGGSWTAFSGYSANTGSGLRSLAAQQLCDCNVSIGSHKYELTVSTGGKERTLPVSVAVVPSLEEPKDAGAPVGDFQPWDIPEPNPVQGLDCKTACSAPAPDQGTAPKPDSGARDVSIAPGADAKVNPPAVKDEGGCSLAAGRATAATGLALLLALALLAAVLRRR